MAALIFGSPSRWQPQGAISLLTDHWAAPQTTSEGLWLPPYLARNLSGGAIATGTYSRGAASAGNYGSVLIGTFNGTSDSLSTGISGAPSSNGVTLIALARGRTAGDAPGTTTANGPMYAGGYGLIWEHNNTAYNSAFYIKGDGTYPKVKFLSGGGNLSAETWYLLVGVAASGRMEAWANGVLGNSITTNWGTQTDAFGLNLAVSSGSGTIYWGGDVAFALKLDRALSQAQIIELSRNPWQLFQRINRRIYFGIAAAAADNLLGQAVL